MSTTLPASTQAPAFTIAEATDVGFWQRLCPALSIDGGGNAPAVTLPDLAGLLADIKAEGYVNEPGVFPAEFVSRLRECFLLLQARGIPTPFVFVYDEPWLMFRAVAPFLEAQLGRDYAALPCFWAWCVEPSDAAAGWQPHRDRPRSLGDDGVPQSMTVWLPLSDATPLNGCIYVLPQQYDEPPKARQPGTLPPLHQGDQLQNVRALPATAGSLLAWHQDLLHWGSRASRRGKAPRCSMALEFQRRDRPAFEAPLLRADAMLSFHGRLGMIARQLRAYQRWQSFTPAIKLLAVMLEMKFRAK